jgi:excinuclease ABC subunit C
MDIKYFKKKKLPDSPGVYLFKKNKQILYVGKATSLRDRVRSYMSKTVFDTRGPLIEKMIEEANRIDWQVTDSVLEALILEAALIKKHQPKYNTKEKSDKSFNYVCITKELIPKVLVVRGKDVKHRVFDKVFGPYPNGSQLRDAMKIVRKIFPFLDDKSKNYIEFYKQINLVPDLNDIKIYLQNIKNIKLFFSGKKQSILKNLKKGMVSYAKNKEFEKAGEIKRQLFALQHINDVALIKNNTFADNKIFDPAPFFGRIRGNKVGPSDTKILLSAKVFRIEAYDIAHMSGKNMVGVMVVVEDGESAKNEYRKFKIKTQNGSNDTGALKEVLERRLAHNEWAYPHLIVVDGSTAQINTAESILLKFNLSISVVSVVKDERHKPKEIIGDKKFTQKYKKEILLANSEAHRFAIAYHKKVRGKDFLK